LGNLLSLFKNDSLGELIQIFKDIVSNCELHNENEVIDMIVKYGHSWTDDDGANIFTMKDVDTDNNNLLAICIINYLETATDIIITGYNKLFDLGYTNELGETALILAIENNSFFNAYNLVTEFLDECNPGQLTNDDHLSALDFMLQKEKSIIAENIEIVVYLLHYYIENDPYSEVYHRNIDIICRNLEFYKPLIQPRFDTEKLNLNEVFCKGIKNTKAEENTGLFSKVYTSVPNTLGMVRINGRKINVPLPVARKFNVPLTVTRNDDYYSPEYSGEEENQFRLSKKYENRGGTKQRKLKKSKKSKKGKTIKNFKNPRNKKRHNKTIRQRRCNRLKIINN
jgi:hypothetical protein